MYSKIDRLMLFFAQPSDAIAAGCSPITKIENAVAPNSTELSGWEKRRMELKKEHNVLSMLYVSLVATTVYALYYVCWVV